MASDPKVLEAMEWQEGEAPDAGDELSSIQAPSVETTITHLAQTHLADSTHRSPVGLGFLDKYGK